MRKFVFTILLSGLFVSGFAQEIWSLEAIAKEMPIEEYGSYVLTLTKYRKLQSIALECNKSGEYEKAVLAYQYMADEFIGKMNKKDVANFYGCLLVTGRIDDVPYEGLQKFSKDFIDLLKIARIRRDVRDDVDESDTEHVKRMNNKATLTFGYTLQQQNKLSMYSDSLNQLFSYDLTSKGFRNPELVEHGFKDRYKVLAMEKGKGETCMYTIFDADLGLYKIEIVGDDLPAFEYNSRYFSVAMPWFDSKTESLFFCSDDKKGYGGWDIYHSKLDKKKWLKPELLDESVNSTLNEMFPSVDDDMLLFSSNGRKGKGGLDNYAFDMVNKISYNLFDCNTALNDYCIRMVNDSTDFFICRENNIMNGRFNDFWQRAVKEEDLGAARESLALRLKPFTLVVPEIKAVEIPEIYNFDCGESIYFPFDEEVFDKKFNAYLDQCLEYFSSMKNIKEILIFGSADPCGDDTYNYLLSLKRARRIIAYMKRHSSKNFTYRTIVLGEQLYKESALKTNDEYREVFFRAINFKLPFDTMIAVPLHSEAALNKLAERYNNTICELEKINKLLTMKEIEGVSLVGIQTIHRVYNKETLFALAVRYSCSVKDIMLVNGKTSSFIKTGELLIIPHAQ